MPTVSPDHVSIINELTNVIFYLIVYLSFIVIIIIIIGVPVVVIGHYQLLIKFKKQNKKQPKIKQCSDLMQWLFTFHKISDVRLVFNQSNQGIHRTTYCSSQLSATDITITHIFLVDIEHIFLLFTKFKNVYDMYIFFWITTFSSQALMFVNRMYDDSHNVWQKYFYVVKVSYYMK